ncbi:conserved hypothetical protein [Candidatus Sulfopaludibacter sp. SbA3]|nr:conserved hypothetical protein [Candidatus Sulfopaludibacter sp. SbA3]
MNRNETANPGAIGLDVGTSRIVAARQADQQIRYTAQLNAFVGIPYSRITQNVLQREGVPHTIQGDEIIVTGNESERFADFLNKDIRRTMSHGLINADEPDGAKFIRAIASSVAGKAEKGQKLCFTVPAAPIGAAETLTYHEAALRQILGGLGFEVSSINEGLAVVYAELDGTNYTGIGISCGGGLCNVCFSYLSVPVLTFSLPKAGDFIDGSAASVIGERANRVRMLKEQSFYLNGHSPLENKLQQVLTVYYDDLIQSLVASLRSAFQSARNLPKLSRPIPLVLSGGTAIPEGFRDRFESALRSSDFPIALSEIRMAAEPQNTTAKGALVAALSSM